MDQLLGRCSESLIVRLAGGTRSEATLRMRRDAARVLEQYVLTLEAPHAQVLRWRYGIRDEALDGTEIAARLGVASESVEKILDAAHEALGWALVSGADGAAEGVAA
jgi:DNA-directed RNA polymerase sigma subunit (sigma70/sigma32)